MADPTEHAPAKPQRSRTSTNITVHDVARLAAVSIMTVSRAVNFPEQLSPETLRRVQEAIRETGYVPNLAAGGLKSAKSRLVVALVPTMYGQLFVGMIESLTSALRARGFQLMIGQTGYSADGEDALLNAIIGRRPEGIFLTGVLHSEASRKILSNSRIPIVETWDSTASPIDMLVGVSQEDIGRDVCRYLVQKGRRHLALFTGDDPRGARRRIGFLREAEQLGLPVPFVLALPAPTLHEGGRQALRALLAQGFPVNGIFCSSDMLALGVLTECRVHGIDVPETVSVVGFGDIEFASSIVPALTTVKIDGEAIGRIAANMLADRGEGRDSVERNVDVGFRIVARDSA